MSQSTRRTHPVHAFARQLTGRLDDLSATPVWSMQPEERRESLLDLARAEAQLASLRLRVLAEADRAGDTDDTAACTIADWVAVETRQVRRDARSDLRLAEALERHDVLSGAMTEGKVNTAQARAIVASLDMLPTTGEFAVSTEQRRAAETHLVALAQHHGSWAGGSSR